MLKTDESGDGAAWSDEAIRKALDVGLSTVMLVRQRFVEEGLEAALERHQPRRDYSHLLNASAKPIFSPWPAVRRLWDTSVGRCACWLTSWSSASTLPAFRTRTVRQVLKKGT